MQKLWYNYEEVNEFHPIVEQALNEALINTGYAKIAEVCHHPSVPNSTIVPDFGIRLKSSQKYIFIIEVKRSNRDVSSQRYQNQSRNYVTEFAPHWQSNYHKYFCITNVEQLILFADRQGHLSTCTLKDNFKVHPPFQPKTHAADTTIAAFQATIEDIFRKIFSLQPPEWENNWQPIIEQFYQNHISLKGGLAHAPQAAEELSLYELFRLFAFVYLREFYFQQNSLNKTYFKGFPTDKDEFKRFVSRLKTSYDRILQLDFKQIFSNHPNSAQRIFPDNFSEQMSGYFKRLIRSLNQHGDSAVKNNPAPSYIFNLLTSKIYDWEQMHKKGKVMSDTELANLLVSLSINSHTDKVLDPGCGDGALLDAAYDYLEYVANSNGINKPHNTLLEQTTGVEIDPFLAQLTTFRLISKNLNMVDDTTEADITVGDIFRTPRAKAFDVVVMNPPFLRNDNPAAPITVGSKNLMISAIKNQGIASIFDNTRQPNLYFYFVNYIWHYLTDNGRAGIILMTKFLNNKDGKYLKEFLLDKVEAIISYPRNYFEGFSVTTVIVILAKKPSNNIKFLNILESGLLENSNDIKGILSNNQNTIGLDYTLRVTDRNIDPKDNWKLYLTDPEDKFDTLQSLSFLEPLSTFFETVKRGVAANSGGSNIIYPDFTKEPYNILDEEYIGCGIKSNRRQRSYILSDHDLNIDKAIHFPSKYDIDSIYGLHDSLVHKKGLFKLFVHNHVYNQKKWKKIVNETYRSKITFDILIPRAERAKHSCYFNPSNKKIVLSTNFVYLSDFRKKNTNNSISVQSQKKFIAAYLLSSFGQLQYEINSNNQEGLRKIEVFHIEKFKVPDLRILTKNEVEDVVTAFDNLNSLNVTFKGDEGLSTPRSQLDIAVGQIIFNRNNLGFDNVDKLVKFFELFLSELVDERNPNE